MKKLITLFVVISVKMFSQNYPISDIPEELKKDANAVVRNYSSEYIIKSEDDMEINEKRVISILNKAGEKYSYVYIPYDKVSKISNIKLKILDNNGKPIKTYSKSDLNDISQSNDSYLYSDYRALASRIIQPLYPYTIELSYTVRTSDTAFLPEVQPFLSENVSIENWSIGFKNESGINLRKKITDTSFGKVNISEGNNSLNAFYKNIPAYKAEKYAPDLETLFPKIEFALDKACLKGKCGDFSSWQSLAKWYNSLLEPVSIITPDIQNEVNSLNLTGSNTEKVKKIYQYMQKKTRYVFVGIGIGGWQPMVADDVRKKAYGDCKALTNYMRILLKAANIPSYYAKIYMDNTPILFDEKFPKMGGNHVVLYIPSEDGDVWLENTSQNIAFNHLGYSTRNRNAVLIDDKITKVINTPVYKSEDSEEEMHFSAIVSEDNSLSGISQFAFTGGLYDFQLGKMTMTNEEVKNSLKEDLNYLNFSEINYTNLNNDRDNGKLSFDIKFKANNFSKTLGNDIYFRALPIADNGFYLENSEDRKFPVEVAFGFTDNYEIEYSIPKNYKFSEIPLAKKIDSEYGNYSIEFSQKEDKIIIKRKFKLNKGIIPVDKISNYINFRKQINKIDATKILITKL
ncbi:MAG: DUF3857 domain-containing protein [Chryseobacterium sp.]|nr:MAG: DUF3857 domain-containing protein [Chryseobacterium sp.]